MARVISPEEFTRNYHSDPNQSKSERLAIYLYELSVKCPKRYASRRLCTRVAFSLTHTPREDHHYVKQLRNVISSTRKILQNRYGKELNCDPIEGIRSTVDSEDARLTVDRAKDMKIISAVKSSAATKSRIKADELSPTVRKGFLQSCKALKEMTQAISNLPQLPAKKDKEED